MVLRRLTLPLRRLLVLVFLSEFAEVEVDVVLRKVVVLAKLIPELLDVPLVLFLSASTFIFELVLPACLLGQKGRVRSLGRLNRYRLRWIIFWYLEDRLEVAYEWFDRNVGAYLNCSLRSTTHKELLERPGFLSLHVQLGLHALLPLQGLLGKVSVHYMPPFIAEFLNVVIIEPTVLLRQDMPVGIRDVARVYPVRAVLAGEDLQILIKRQTLSLEPNKGVFPGGVHAKRYLFNN